MSQAFYEITTRNITPSSVGAWITKDVSPYVPAGATGVILHCVNSDAVGRVISVRKKGSTDTLTKDYASSTHNWVAIGIDGDRKLEAYVGHTANCRIWLIGYTTSEVTFFTNMVNKSPGATGGAWVDVDCSSECPDATGLIFLVSSGYDDGIRKKGSTDNRKKSMSTTYGIIIGCDVNQVCQINAQSVYSKFYLIGYVTSGVHFNTNATNISLSVTGAWTDLSALPTGSVFGFVEVYSSASYYYGLRKNGDSEEIYRYTAGHSWGFLPCDASGIIEGKISNTGCDFFLVGYADVTFEATPAGALSMSGGIVARTIYKALSGTLSAIGHVDKDAIPDFVGSGMTYGKFAFGRRTFGGASALYKYEKPVIGALPLIGALGRKIFISLSGAVTSSGAALGALQFPKSIGGALTFSGSIDSFKRDTMYLLGALAPTGIVGRKVLVSLSGLLASSGIAYKKTLLYFDGALTSSGTVTTKFLKLLSGTLTSAGGLARKIVKALSGVITFVGKPFGPSIPFIPITVTLHTRDFAFQLHNRSLVTNLNSRSLIANLASRNFIASLNSRSIIVTMGGRQW